MTDSILIGGPERDVRDNTGRKHGKAIDKSAKDAFARAIEDAPGGRADPAAALDDTALLNEAAEPGLPQTQSAEEGRLPEPGQARSSDKGPAIDPSVPDIDIPKGAFPVRAQQPGKTARETFARFMDEMSVARDRGDLRLDDLTAEQAPDNTDGLLAAVAKSAGDGPQTTDEPIARGAPEPTTTDAPRIPDPAALGNPAAASASPLAGEQVDAAATAAALPETRTLRWGLDRSPTASTVQDHGEAGGPAADPDLIPTVKVSHQETHFAPLMNAAQQTAQQPAQAPPRPSLEGLAVPGSDPKTAVSSVITSSAEAVDQNNVTSEPEPVWVQVADATASLLSDLDTDHTEPATPSRALPDDKTPGGPVRFVKLQLTPDAMGTIDVMLTKRHGGLSVHLGAQLPEVAGRLQDDRVVLSDRLASTGHHVAELSIGVTASSQVPAQTSDRMGQDQNQQGGFRFSDNTERQASAHSGRDGREPGQQQERATAHSAREPSPVTQTSALRSGHSTGGFRPMRSV